MLPPSDEIVADFELLDDVEAQFEYLMELGRLLPKLPEALHTDDRLVPGCQSRVWLDMQVEGTGRAAVMRIGADSDAHITRGLVAFLVALYGNRPVAEILETDALATFRSLGLGQHVTSKRANGLRSMVDRIQGEASRVAAAA